MYVCMWVYWLSSLYSCHYIGTTTPITFVKGVLFPYSSTHLTQHLTDTLDSPTTQTIITALLDQHQKDVTSHSPGGSVEIKYHSDGKVVIDTVSEYARALIHADRKVPPLKQLQGNIWKKGYACGDLHAVVYEDVKPFLTRMRECDVSVCIYSSGSRGAQQLLFKYTNEGDLRPYLNAYFDTTVGQKQSASSYADILLTLGCTDTPSDVVFVTDVVGEATAALEAGMRAVVSVREGNAPLPVGHGFPVITSFDQLQWVCSFSYVSWSSDVVT
jgi:methylthioribulose 1-phosphate dehydratase/enolase-phosphatase E1